MATKIHKRPNGVIRLPLHTSCGRLAMIKGYQGVDRHGVGVVRTDPETSPDWDEVTCAACLKYRPGQPAQPIV